MIEADILIAAKKSTFSFYAGLISDCIKIFDPETPIVSALLAGTANLMPYKSWLYPCRPEDWIPSREDGSIDRGAFEARLDILLRADAGQ